MFVQTKSMSTEQAHKTAVRINMHTEQRNVRTNIQPEKTNARIDKRNEQSGTRASQQTD